MARRRYISTEISVDKEINRLAEKDGPMAALLYTWMLPHAEDDRSITADPDEILLTVIPGFRKATAEQVQKYLDSMVDKQLLQKHEGRLYFPAESFYKYQSYVPEGKRNNTNYQTPQNTEERRETPQNTASPSPSPSPLPSLIKDIYAQRFTQFWQVYPKKRSKGDAEKAWNKLKPDEQLHNRIMQSLEQAKTSADWVKEGGQYIPYPATWLNAKGWEDEYKPPEPPKGGKVIGKRYSEKDDRDWEKILGLNKE